MDGYPCARYKKLRTLDEAEAWMQRAVPYPVKQKPTSSSFSIVKPSASSQSPLVSGSESQIAPGLPSVKSHAAAGHLRMSATAEDVVYTDGACPGNGRPGSVAGIGVWWGVNDSRYVLPSINDTVRFMHERLMIATSPSAALADKPTTELS